MKIDTDNTILNVAVLLGGTSPEHEVSVISGMQAVAAFDRSRYNPIPVYIAKDGTWYIGPVLSDLDSYKNLPRLTADATPVVPARSGTGKLRLIPETQSKLSIFRKSDVLIDVVFFGLHGGEGEDGSIQGMLESFNVPYTGSGVFASAMGMDKVATKQVCRTEGIPVVDYQEIYEDQWANREDEWLDTISRHPGLPAVVKPARLGSSIGISFANDREALDRAVEEAFRYDDKIVVETAIGNLTELNCSVLGSRSEAEASVLEQPVSSDELLTFKDKYMRGSSAKGKQSGKTTGPGSAGMASLDRLIPAPVSNELEREAKDLALRIFRTFECSGVARVDLMLDNDTGKLYFNEINTTPGSFSFYLWEPSGVPFDELVHRLVQLALQTNYDRNRRVRTYDVNLLATADLKGLKGKG